MSKDGDGEEATEEARKGQNGEKAQNGAREQEGGVEEQQGLRCGEANPNQGLVGASGATWDGLFRLMRPQDGLVLEALRVRAARDLVGFRLPCPNGGQGSTIKMESAHAGPGS